MQQHIGNVEELVQMLGIRRTLKGRHLLLNAIRMTLDDEDYFLKLMHLYDDIASSTDTQPSCVEHNIRTAIENCWNHGNQTFLHSISPYALLRCPSNGEFLEIIISYCQRQGIH